MSEHLIGRATGRGIRYPMAAPDHPLLGLRVADAALRTAAGPTRIAQLMQGGAGLVLDFAGKLDPALLHGWQDRLNVVQAEPVEYLDVATLLVRPDGYVAYVDTDGEGQDGLREAVVTWLGAARPDQLATSAGPAADTLSGRFPS